MIKHIHIENFKCFKDFDLDLGPFNVLVGPNDSGKTSLLQAIHSFIEATQGELHRPRFMCKSECWWQGNKGQPIRLQVSTESDEGVPSGTGTIEFHEGEDCAKFSLLQANSEMAADPKNPITWSQTVLGEMPIFRLVPEELRRDTPSETPERFRMAPFGLGFPTYLENLLRESRQSFFSAEKAFYEQFPQYREILLTNAGGKGKTINSLQFKLQSGAVIDAEGVSDGAMLYFAFLALTNPYRNVRLLAVEEPENGVHHAALQDIVTMLKDFANKRGAQVILTTHSPYLLDLVKPEEVKVFHKKADGSVEAKAMSDYEEVQVMKKHFMTGTIWTELGEERIMEGAKGE